MFSPDKEQSRVQVLCVANQAHKLLCRAVGFYARAAFLKNLLNSRCKVEDTRFQIPLIKWDFSIFTFYVMLFKIHIIQICTKWNLSFSGQRRDFREWVHSFPLRNGPLYWQQEVLTVKLLTSQRYGSVPVAPAHKQQGRKKIYEFTVVQFFSILLICIHLLPF